MIKIQQCPVSFDQILNSRRFNVLFTKKKMYMEWELLKIHEDNAQNQVVRIRKSKRKIRDWTRYVELLISIFYKILKLLP
jgi:hypothetical protein